MKNIFLPLIVLSLFFASCKPTSQKSETLVSEPEMKLEYPEIVEFESLDSLQITANLYQIDEVSPFILLCHQARFNKFEYAGIAERLNQMGFNCMAIDQRSGGPIGNTQNETYLRALKMAKGVDFVDAEADILASVDFLTEKYTSKVILWGSSYSSTLALYIAAEREDVSAVISFSPGNYMAETKGSLVDVLEDFNKPMFITSSNSEAKYVTDLLTKHKLLEKQVQFVPEGAGHHGSRALWENQQGGEEYWLAITDFLNQLK